MSKVEEPEINFSAPLNPPKRGRGRPKKLNKPCPTKKPQKVSSINIGDLGEDYISANNLENQLTEKELKFLQIYLTGNYTQEKAMELAGYENYHPTYRRFLACKIVKKYEASVPDHRDIMRALAMGEVEVIKGLITLAKTAKSEMVRLNAYDKLSKCLGLQKEVIEGGGGLKIIFLPPDQPAAGVVTILPGQPESVKPKVSYLPQSSKPLMITK